GRETPPYRRPNRAVIDVHGGDRDRDRRDPGRCGRRRRTAPTAWRQAAGPLAREPAALIDPTAQTLAISSSRATRCWMRSGLAKPLVGDVRKAWTKPAIESRKRSPATM